METQAQSSNDVGPDSQSKASKDKSVRSPRLKPPANLAENLQTSRRVQKRNRYNGVQWRLCLVDHTCAGKGMCDGCRCKSKEGEAGKPVLGNCTPIPWCATSNVLLDHEQFSDKT